MGGRDERFDSLMLDVDLRLRDVWKEAFGWEDQLCLGTVGALMRMAYGRGYVDALTEPVKAQLCRDHGYQVPKRG